MCGEQHDSSLCPNRPLFCLACDHLMENGRVVDNRCTCPASSFGAVARIHVPCNLCVDGVVHGVPCTNCDGAGEFILPSGFQSHACPIKVHKAIKEHQETWDLMERVGVGGGLDHRNCPCGGTISVLVPGYDFDAEDAADAVAAA